MGKLDVVAHACNPSLQGQGLHHNKFKASLVHMLILF